MILFWVAGSLLRALFKSRSQAAIMAVTVFACRDRPPESASPSLWRLKDGYFVRPLVGGGSRLPAALRTTWPCCRIATFQRVPLV